MTELPRVKRSVRRQLAHEAFLNVHDPRRLLDRNKRIAGKRRLDDVFNAGEWGGNRRS